MCSLGTGRAADFTIVYLETPAALSSLVPRRRRRDHDLKTPTPAGGCREQAGASIVHMCFNYFTSSSVCVCAAAVWRPFPAGFSNL